MKELAYTLMTDGSSDKALLPVMNWLLLQHLPAHPLQLRSKWVDLREQSKPPSSLEEKIAFSLRFYPCDLLFIHRDAEKQSRQKRKDEILNAYSEAQKLLKKDKSVKIPEYVCVVPVRMLETWLLFDEAAMREATKNPHGRQTLELPSLRKLESEPAPKKKLHELLRDARGLSGRRRKRFNVDTYVHRLANCIKDFTPLRQLTAFRALEAELIDTLDKLGFLENKMTFGKARGIPETRKRGKSNIY